VTGAPNLRVITGEGEIAEDLTAIPSDEAVLVERLKKAGREIAALKGQIARLAAADPNAETVTALLQHWQKTCGHPRAKIPLDGVRADAARKMLKAKYTPEQLRFVIDVAAEQPWMGDYGQRFTEPGDGRKRRDELTLLFRDEKHVEDLIRLGTGANTLREYRRFVHRLVQEHPKLVTALALLAAREPVRGEVLASAAMWAKGEVTRNADHR
jgi:hypothetical protein